MDCQSVPRHATQTNRHPPITLMHVIMLAVNKTSDMLQQCDADVSTVTGEVITHLLRRKHMQYFLHFS